MIEQIMNKNNNNPILYRMCVGTAIGATFGVVSEHPILGMSIGLGLGLFTGIL